MPTEPNFEHISGCHRPTDHSGACSPQRDDGLPYRPHGITDHVLREQYVEQLPCIGDTDGDGNCPLPLCMHCKPHNFTVEQLRRAVYESWPFRALAMLTTKEQADPSNGIGVATYNVPVVDDPRDETPFTRIAWTPVKDKEQWLAYCDSLWEVTMLHQANLAAKAKTSADAT